MVDEQHRRALHDAAYAAMDAGALAEASRHFASLLEDAPDDPGYHYMRGLAHKYRFDWPTSLAHNLRAIALMDEVGEAEHWNAAIAATAIGDWERVRALWRACGIRVPDGEGPIDSNHGVAVVRLTPWHGGETVWMRRIDPVRARLLNVPLPESGHRFGDIVLHDGASTGSRWNGDARVPVFNALQRLERSDFTTHVAFVGCDRAEDLAPLLEASAPGIGHIEDWTDSVRHYCMRCSYGTPHRHAPDTASGAWSPDRNIGIAAQSRKSAEKVLAEWARGGRGRRVEGIETPEHAIPERVDGRVWWRNADDADEDDADEDDADAADSDAAGDTA